MTIKMSQSQIQDGRAQKQSMRMDDLTSCIHGGKTIWHSETVCPVCENAAKRGQHVADLAEAIIDAVKAGGGDPEVINNEMASACKRIDNLIQRIHGGMTDGE